jgi:hypothetical protein
MSVTGAIVAGVGAASAIGGAAISAHAAGKAANTQANAANYAANLEKQSADESLAFQKQQYDTNQKNFAPWLNAGTGAIQNLQYLLGIPQGQAPSSTNAVPSGGNGYGYAGDVRNSGGYTPDDPAVRNRMMLPAGMEQRADPAEFGQPSQPATQGGQPGAPGAQGGSQINPALGNFGSLLTPWTEQFKAPDGITEQNDPGFKERLKLGTDALERSAAARGGVLTGGTAKDLNSFAQDYASNEYGNVYSRAWNDYSSRYNNFQNNNTNTFNRLATVAGMGQTSANQLGMMGQNTANNVSSTLLNSAGMIGQQYNNAAAARGSGYVGTANAINGGIGGTSSALENFLLLQKLYGGGAGGGGGINPAAPGDFSICWVAAELYGGWDDARTKKVRKFLRGDYRSTKAGGEFVEKYEKNGERVAELAKAHPELKEFLRPIFDGFLASAEAMERRDRVRCTDYEL